MPQANYSVVESGQANSLEFFANTGSYAMSYDWLDWAKTWYGDPANNNAPVKYLKYEFDVYIPSGEVSDPQALEFECQQETDNYLANFAYQNDYNDIRQWRSFLYGNTNQYVSTWESVGIPYTKLAGDTWYHVTLEYHVDLSVTPPLLHHDAATIYQVGGSGRQPTLYNNIQSAVTSSNSQMTNAVQLDTDGGGTAYSIYIDNMGVKYTQ